MDTVILALSDPDTAVHRATEKLGLNTLAIDEVGPGRVSGRSWCFVDWLHRDSSGFEICRQLRQKPETARSHITMILEEDDSEIRRRALRAGADDYLLGPATPGLISTRLKQYRGDGEHQEPLVIVQGPFVMDKRAHQLRWNGKVIAVPPNEFRLLAHFLQNPDELHSRESLSQALSREGRCVDQRSVDVYIGRLRRVLKGHAIPDPFRTVRSMGYVFDSPT